DDPEISDVEFDQLLRELRHLESEYPHLITPESPTQRVSGRPVGGFASVAHAESMLSPDNAYNTDELREFDKRVCKVLELSGPVAYAAELKIDGLGIALTYENGRLIRGVTRGDGTHGEDVVTEAGPGLVPHRAEAPGDVTPHLGAQPQDELSLGETGQVPRRHGGDHRGARKGHRNGGAQIQARGGGGGEGQRQERIVLGLRGEEAVVAEIGGARGRLEGAVGGRGRKVVVDLHEPQRR
ncbi:MAG TPA: hypothetical protein EYP73_05105, partial [Acidimicrobiia bacterium]|nr:hypothetical protein [Acidimicrobiia bacterium]